MGNYSGKIEVGSRILNWETTFSDNLRFSCSNSGLCCMATNVELFDVDVSLLKEVTNKNFEQSFVNPLTHISSKRIIDTDEKDCMFLKSNKCNVYSNRPKSCRTFPFKLVIEGDSAYIDVVYGCKSIINEQFSSSNEVDFGKLVRDEVDFLEKIGLQSEVSSEIKILRDEFGKDYNYSIEIVKKCVDYLKNLKNLDELYFLLSMIQAMRINLKDSLDVDSFFNNSIDFFNTQVGNLKVDNEIDSFLNSVFFKAYDLGRSERYKLTIHDSINFNYVNGDKKEFELDSLDKFSNNISENEKEFLKNYFNNILIRKTTEMSFYNELNKNDLEIDIVVLMLEMWKYIVKHINSLMLVNSLKSGKVDLDCIKEAIMMYDGIVLHCPSIFVPKIIKK